MKKSEEEKVEQMKFIEENTEKLYDKLRNMNVEMKQSKEIEGSNVLSLLCSALLQDYKGKQSSMLDIITATQHGKLNPLILTPEQLMSQLRFIKNHIQSPFQLPLTLDGHTLLTAYRLLNVQYRLREDYVIFVVTVPLVRETKFELYKVYPLPTHINNAFVSIETKTEYILISAHRDRFYRLTELDLLKGEKINEEMYLIHQKGPIYNKNAQQNCELELFTQFTLPASCKLKMEKPARMWIQLETLNHWLFSLDKKYIITFVCQSGIWQKTLQGTGILNLNDDCVLQDDELSISSSHIKETKIIKYFQPPINITSLNLFNENATDDPLKITWNLNYTNNSKLITDLSKYLTEIKLNQQQPLQQLSTHDIHLYTVGYTTSAIVTIIIIYLVVTYIRHRPRTIKIINKTEPSKAKQTTAEDYNFEVKDFKRGQDVNKHTT